MNAPTQNILVLTLAVAIDVFLPDLPNSIHPVAWTGRAVRSLKRLAPARPSPALLYGAVSVLGGVGVSPVVAESKRCLCRELEAPGIGANSPAANYSLAKVGRAANMRTANMRRGVAVRDCTSFGLPGHIRIPIRRREEGEKLVGALREEWSGGR